MRNELCKSCVYRTNIGECGCGVKPESEGRVCPCVNCLVKVMCGGSCDAWSNYEKFVNKKGVGHLTIDKLNEVNI